MRFSLQLLLIASLLIILAACSAAPQGPVDAQGNIVEQAQVESVSVAVSGETPPYEIVVEVRGTLPDACTQPGNEVISRQDDRFLVELTTLRPAKERCKKEPKPFVKNISLNGLGLVKGEYEALVNGVGSSFVLAQDNVPPTPTPTPTPIPPVLLPAIDPPTPTPGVAPQETSVAAEDGSGPCTNRIKFIEDVTVPDKMKIDPNARFTKTWRLQNAGTCTWTDDYALVFARGEQMGGPDRQPLGMTVKPGKTVDISVDLIAPAVKGVYTSEWLLQTPAGEKFGLGKDGATPFWLKIRVPRDAPAGGAANGVISGFVWHDLCAADQATADALPDGCEIAPNGGVMADGVYQPGEPAIGGVEISLGAGPCPASGLAVVKSNTDGKYQFKGLKPGDYCVSIDAASDYNHYILIPGQWTIPPGGRLTVTLAAGEARTDVNFGWDYELAP